MGHIIFKGIMVGQDYIDVVHKDTKNTVVRVYRSSRASDQQNWWLIKKLIEIYTIYYLRVAGNNLLRFFKED